MGKKRSKGRREKNSKEGKKARRVDSKAGQKNRLKGMQSSMESIINGMQGKPHRQARKDPQAGEKRSKGRREKNSKAGNRQEE